MCDKLDVWKNMQFNTRISSAHWMAEDNCWKLTDTSGQTYTSRFLITAIGVLSNPTLPNVPGVEDFKGTAYHTSRWPKQEVSFVGKRVGIIGEIVPCPTPFCGPDDMCCTIRTLANRRMLNRRHRSDSYTSDTGNSQDGQKPDSVPEDTELGKQSKIAATCND